MFMEISVKFNCFSEKNKGFQLHEIQYRIGFVELMLIFKRIAIYALIYAQTLLTDVAYSYDNLIQAHRRAFSPEGDLT